MPAFGAAVAMGAEEIEIDIWNTSDGVLVSCHDSTLDRVSNGHGKIYEHTYEELLKLDFGVKYGDKFRGLKIPTFEEILRSFAGRVIMNIHVKIWDEDFAKDNPLAQMGITASETDGVGRFVCEDGAFLGLPLAHADWLWYTDATEYGDMFVIYGQFDDGEDDFWYEIYLRPWGADWSDVAANGEPIPYYYDDWYVPLVNSGVTEAPAGFVAGEGVV